MGEFSREFTMRWSDADANGHVRHTVYAELAVEARMAFLAEAGFGWMELSQAGIGPVLLREELDYMREIGLGERVRVDLELVGASPDGARWKIRHGVFKATGEQAGRVTVTGGWIDLSSRKLAHPPEPLRTHFATAPRAADFEELRPLRR